MDLGPLPIHGEVAQITHTAQIEVRAPAGAAFAVVAEDILAVEDDRTEMCGHRPIDDGPLRVGFRWQQTIVHDRVVCRSDWIVTELREPSVLEQLMEHICMSNRKEVLGGERWHFHETGDGSTIVSLRAWRTRDGLLGLVERFMASSDDAIGVSLRARLANVQFRAEQGAPHAA